MSRNDPVFMACLLVLTIAFSSVVNAGQGDAVPPTSLRARGNRQILSIANRTDRTAAINFMQQRTYLFRINDERGGGVITMVWPNPRIVAAVTNQAAVRQIQVPNDESRARRRNGLGVFATLPNVLVRAVLRNDILAHDLRTLRLVSPEMRFQVDEAMRNDESAIQIRERLRYFDYIRSHFSLGEVIRIRSHLIFYESQNLGVSIFDPRFLREGFDPIVAVVVRCAAIGWSSTPFMVHNQLIGCSQNCLFYLINERGQGSRSLFYVCRPELLEELQDSTIHAEVIDVQRACMVELPEAIIFLTVGFSPNFLIRKSDLNGEMVRRQVMIPTNPRHVLYANGYVWVLGQEDRNAISQLFALDPQRLMQEENAIVATYEFENVGQIRVVGNYLQLRDELGGRSRFFRMDPMQPCFLRTVPGVGEADTRDVVVDGDFAYFSERTNERLGAVNLRDIENLNVNPFRGYVRVQGDLTQLSLAAGRSLLVGAAEMGRVYIVNTRGLQNGNNDATVLELGVALGEPIAAGNYFFVADIRGERIFAIDGRTHRLIADVHTTLHGLRPTIPIQSSRRNLIYAHGYLFLVNQVDGTTKIFDLGGFENL